MSKDKISDYSATANSNTDIGGINIDEGCAPSGINDAIRTLMKQLKDWQSGSQDVYIHPAGSASAPSVTATGDTNTGLFFPAADTVALTTGGSERMRLDSSGNLGLGVTPSAWSSSYKALQVGPSASMWSTGSGGARWGVNYYLNASDVLTYIGSNYSTDYRQSNGAHSWYYAASGTAGNSISFTQAMTLDASGKLLVGTTTASGNIATFKGSQQSFIIRNGVDSDYNEFGVWDGASDGLKAVIKCESTIGKFGTRTNSFMGLQTNDTMRVALGAAYFAPSADNTYTLGANGGRWSAVWAANGTIQTSDEREKTNITPSDLGLDFIMQLQPVSYKWKQGGNEIVISDEDVPDGGGSKVETVVSKEGKRTHYGFIAQQVKQTVGDKDFGGWILTDANDPESQQALRYDQFISPLVKAIQEQQAMIASQSEIITQLQADVAALKG